MTSSSLLVVRRLQSLISTRWTPKMDLELLLMQHRGKRTEHIGQALTRSPEEVVARFHKLRKIPGVIASLREYLTVSDVYVAYRPESAQEAPEGPLAP